MSQDAPALSRKDRKALRDAERRANKKSKTKTKAPADSLEHAEDVENADSHPDDDAGVFEPLPTKSKKRKAKDDVAQGQQPASAPSSKESQPNKKRKKERQTQHSTKPTDTDPNAPSPDTPDDTKTKSRFIVFVGNLPYATTDASLQAHFSKLQPFTLRHRTDPKTHKSKGFAFLEFENYDRMKTCLKLYHHTMFDPAEAKAAALDDGVNSSSTPQQQQQQQPRKPSKTARKINVELTAGGGGSRAEARKEKIRTKNVRLEEQRKRRIEAERKLAERKDKRKGAATREEKDGDAGHAKEDAAEDADQGIHPARLAQMMR